MCELEAVSALQMPERRAYSIPEPCTDRQRDRDSTIQVDDERNNGGSQKK